MSLGILSLGREPYLSVAQEPIFWLVLDKAVSWRAKIAHHMEQA
jgi:hypothetical protein